IDSGDLTEQEILYLQDRGKLPPHIRPLQRDPSSGQVKQMNYASLLDQMTIEELEDVLEQKKAQRIANTPTIKDKGGIIEEDDDDSPETYDEGWTNDARRIELAKRGLSVDGNKTELIARLLRSDNDELEDDDIVESEDSEGSEG